MTTEAAPTTAPPGPPGPAPVAAAPGPATDAVGVRGGAGPTIEPAAAVTAIAPGEANPFVGPVAPFLPVAAVETVAGAWERIAAEAAEVHDEVSSALDAGPEGPELLDGLGRAASTLGVLQRRIEAGAGGTGDRAALGAVRDARSSIRDARELVLDALDAWSDGSASA